MKRSILPGALLAFFLISDAAVAATITESYNFNSLNLVVADGSLAGTSNYQPITSAIRSIESIQLTLNISGSFNGDLYAYVSNESAISILLNRTGKTASEPFGYSDDGFSVTFDDTAANGNIHLYQATSAPATGSPLTGTWQPDGRNVSPNAVTDSSPVNALLSSFIGTDADSGWTLYVADVSSGEVHTVDSWSLTITGDTIPESSSALLVVVGAVATLSRRVRCRI